MVLNIKDIALGSIFATIGFLFAGGAWLHLDIGTAFSMGPGYFPLVLGGILMVLGLAIVIRGLGNPPSAFGTVDWRAVIIISTAPVVFAITGDGLGLAPALAVSVLIATFSSRGFSLPKRLALSVCITALCIGIFHYGLNLPMRLIGPWLS